MILGSFVPLYLASISCLHSFYPDHGEENVKTRRLCCTLAVCLLYRSMQYFPLFLLFLRMSQLLLLKCTCTCIYVYIYFFISCICCSSFCNLPDYTHCNKLCGVVNKNFIVTSWSNIICVYDLKSLHTFMHINEKLNNLAQKIIIYMIILKILYEIISKLLREFIQLINLKEILKINLRK